MRLAIQNRNNESFTRPLEVSNLRVVADQKNKMPLPEIDTLQSWVEDSTSGAHRGDQSNNKPQLASSLPQNPDAMVLVGPNVHVYSEELARQIDDQKVAALRLANLK